jgi:hypothetical protein
MVDGSGTRVTSGQRMVAAAALHDAGKLGQDEAMAWADALAVVVEDGQVDAPRVLLARVVDRITAERVRAALLGKMSSSDAALAATVEEVYQAAVAIPAGELPGWAETGIRVPDGRLMLSRHTLDLDAAEAADGRPWPPITVMAHQVVGSSTAVVLEVGPGGMPCFLLSAQARRIAASLTSAADLVDRIAAGAS